MTDNDRSVWTFLAAIRTFPGFGVRVAAAACFTAVLANESGAETALTVVGATLLIGFAIGYPIWRRACTRSSRWG